MLEVSYSRIRTFRNCNRQYYYKYIENLEPKKKPAPLMKGWIIHKMIETYLQKGDWKKELNDFLEEQYYPLFKEEREEVYGKLEEELPEIMKGYIQKWEDQQLEFEHIEIEFKVPLIKFKGETKVLFKGRIDGIARDQNGRRWLVEHKSHKNLPNEDVRFTDLQTCLYKWAVKKAGYGEVDGILWDYIRTKPPVKPELLKNGTLTKRKNIDTTYEMYYQTILDHELDPEDYEDILNVLDEKGDNYYRRVYLPISKEMSNQLVKEMKETSRQIYLKGQKLKSRNPTFLCSGCSYYSLCFSELKGLDADFIRENEFKQREEVGLIGKKEKK